MSNKLNSAEIMAKYNDGMSTYDIAEEYGTYPNRIRRLLVKAGVEMRDKSSAQKTAIESGRSIHPTKGRERTPQEKLKISTATVKHWQDLSPEDKQKKIEVSKEIWKQISPEKKEEMRKLANEQIRKAAKNGSKLERLIQDALIEEAIMYESHKKDVISTQKLEIDLYLPSYRTIIEVDGLSHFEPIWGEENLQKQQKFDNQKDGILLSKGFNIIRIENISGSLALAKIAILKTNLLAVLKDIKDNKLTSTLRVIKYD
jgi:very-short-patch-repair endonuclease